MELDAVAMAGLAAYVFMQIDTGIPLYTTCATADEILRANENLRARGLNHRYVPADGSFTIPSLHR